MSRDAYKAARDSRGAGFVKIPRPKPHVPYEITVYTFLRTNLPPDGEGNYLVAPQGNNRGGYWRDTKDEAMALANSLAGPQTKIIEQTIDRTGEDE
jgi:hypothetical protein